jgi:hypothetical protein
LKTGKTHVPVTNNWQLLFYAVMQGSHRYGRKVHLGIYQPSVSKEIQWWHPSKEDLDAAATRIDKAVNSREFTPGGHCQRCRALPHCWVANSKMAGGTVKSSVMEW